MNLFLVRVQYFLSNFFVLELLTSFCVGLRKKPRTHLLWGLQVLGMSHARVKKLVIFRLQLFNHTNNLVNVNANLQ